VPAAASLPDDIDSLKRLILEQHALITTREEELTSARNALLSRDVLIEKLKIELVRLKRARFGRSSERLDAQVAHRSGSLSAIRADAHRRTSDQSHRGVAAVARRRTSRTKSGDLTGFTPSSPWPTIEGLGSR
jgi:hypothetical protein